MTQMIDSSVTTNKYTHDKDYGLLLHLLFSSRLEDGMMSIMSEILWRKREEELCQSSLFLREKRSS